MHSLAVFNLFITDDVVCLSVCYTCDENRVHQFRANVFHVIQMTHHQIHLRLSIRPLAPHLRRSLAVSSVAERPSVVFQVVTRLRYPFPMDSQHFIAQSLNPL